MPKFMIIVIFLQPLRSHTRKWLYFWKLELLCSYLYYFPQYVCVQIFWKSHSISQGYPATQQPLQLDAIPMVVTSGL